MIEVNRTAAETYEGLINTLGSHPAFGHPLPEGEGLI